MIKKGVFFCTKHLHPKITVAEKDPENIADIKEIKIDLPQLQSVMLSMKRHSLSHLRRNLRRPCIWFEFVLLCLRCRFSLIRRSTYKDSHLQDKLD